MGNELVYDINKYSKILKEVFGDNYVVYDEKIRALAKCDIIVPCETYKYKFLNIKTIYNRNTCPEFYDCGFVLYNAKNNISTLFKKDTTVPSHYLIIFSTPYNGGRNEEFCEYLLISKEHLYNIIYRLIGNNNNFNDFIISAFKSNADKDTVKININEHIYAVYSNKNKTNENIAIHVSRDMLKAESVLTGTIIL